MNKNTTPKGSATPDQIAAIASPLRIELLGLFTTADVLAISDMAELMGRPAGSLYYHVEILEKAGLLVREGTRPKGKRFEALFRPAETHIEVDPPADDDDAVEQTVRIMASAFRMTERDLDAALRNEARVEDGPHRNVIAFRAHMRLSPQDLTRLNEHLASIEELLTPDTTTPPKPGPDDQHLSLTLALLPIKGRGKTETR